MKRSAPDSIEIVYDGLCPFCSSYLRLLRLKDAAPRMTLIDGREHPEVVARLARRGHDLNSGMAVLYGEKIYFGADAINVLALMSSRSGLFDRANHWLLGNRSWATIIYPLLRAGRTATLFLMRRPKIEIG